VSPASSLAKFASDLRRLPKVVALKVAEAAAPVLTDLAKGTFDAGEDAYGRTWKPGKQGQHVTLRRTGDLASFIRYVAAGTRLRVALGTVYARFQIGKRPIFPTQGGELPAAYVQALQREAVRVVKEELRR
jgi:hypothetical protein